MTTKYNLGDTVYILHQHKIKECRIEMVRLHAFTQDNDLSRTLEGYDVSLTGDANFNHPPIKDLDVSAIFPSREALITSL